MPNPNWTQLSDDLGAALHLRQPPIAITFGDQPPPGAPGFDEPLAPAAPDGRTGRVPAGCVFWNKALERTFTTVAEDHGNCSVGSMTHGFKRLEDVAGNDDVAALLGSGWVDEAMVHQIPVVTRAPAHVTYGPLADVTTDPDVVLIRVDGRQLMVLSDALPGLRIEGKPQCHIVAVAKEQGEVAASVGCVLSRVRTGLPSSQMTCAIPAGGLAEVVARVQATAKVDATVAAYAAQDSRRFEAD